MRTSITSSLAFALLVSVTGCFGLFTPDPKVDGESCDDDDDCRSSHCVGGMCTGSSCDHAGDCQGGFSCAEPGTLVEVFSLGLADGSCVPTCDVCPIENPRWTCSGESCGYDGTPWVDPGGPYTAVVGEPVRLSGSAELVDGRDVETASWESWSDGTLGEGLEIDAVFMTPGEQEVTLVVQDDATMSGSAPAMVSVCSPEDGPCGYDGDCCGEGVLVCLLDANGGPSRCGAPPVCGDGVREGGEACDGSDGPPLDCADMGSYFPGAVPCGDDCWPDATACEACGSLFDDCTSDADCCPEYVCGTLDRCEPA